MIIFCCYHDQCIFIITVPKGKGGFNNDNFKFYFRSPIHMKKFPYLQNYLKCLEFLCHLKQSGFYNDICGENCLDLPLFTATLSLSGIAGFSKSVRGSDFLIVLKIGWVSSCPALGRSHGSLFKQSAAISCKFSLNRLFIILELISQSPRNYKIAAIIQTMLTEESVPLDSPFKPLGMVVQSSN